MRAPILTSGGAEGRAKVTRRLGGRSIAGASLLLSAIAAAQGCGGSEFCAENSFECGDPSGGKAGGAGTAGSTSGGDAGTAGKGGATGGSSGAAGRGGSGVGGSAGDGGESGVGAAGSGGEAGGGDPPPPTCDPDALEDGCVPADDALYVSTSGDDDNAGTATAPLGSIGAAVTLAASSGAPIFVCGGTYDEHVVVTEDDIGIHGGFACPTGGAAWVYDSTRRARIAPSTTGYALHVTTVSGLTVTDLELESANAAMPGESSVAVFVSRSEDVAFTRVGITAGDGANGVDGEREGSNHTEDVLTGNNAVGDDGGAVQDMCECPDGSESIGGQGGDGGGSPTGGGAGSPDEGGGQPGTVGLCNTVGTGANGGSPSAAPDGLGAMTLGALASVGWTPTNGASGLNGTPGQGGGGGAGATSGGGGGGACGGCGGKAGGTGTGGGASIGLAAFRSEVALTSVTVATGDAGDGGAGIEGEPGQAGGAGGVKTGLACNGGNGGTGADGAAGGGGAGGISVGILSTTDSMVTAAPSTTFDIGMAGAAGPAAMGSDNAGIPGEAADTLEAS